MFANIRRMHFRDKLMIREIAKATSLSCKTIRTWLCQPAMTEPTARQRQAKNVVDAYADQIRTWMQTDNHRSKREQRAARVMVQALQAQGYSGGYGCVCVRSAAKPIKDPNKLLDTVMATF